MGTMAAGHAQRVGCNGCIKAMHGTKMSANAAHKDAAAGKCLGQELGRNKQQSGPERKSSICLQRSEPPCSCSSRRWTGRSGQSTRTGGALIASSCTFKLTIRPGTPHCTTAWPTSQSSTSCARGAPAACADVCKQPALAAFTARMLGGAPGVRTLGVFRPSGHTPLAGAAGVLRGVAVEQAAAVDSPRRGTATGPVPTPFLSLTRNSSWRPAGLSPLLHSKGNKELCFGMNHVIVCNYLRFDRFGSGSARELIVSNLPLFADCSASVLPLPSSSWSCIA
jgi:hypothetical protein